MLTMEQYSHIRTAYRVYNKSIKQIVRETGHSRNTVRKALREAYKPYKTRDKQHYPVLGPHIPTIREWLESDKRKKPKYRHTARRIHKRLVQEKGFTGSESCVRAYVRQAKLDLGLSGRNVYIPLDPPIGQEAEIDWGEVRAEIAGVEEKLYVFAMRSKFSGKVFIRCYRCERQLAFLDAHVHAFSFFGGTFKTLIYDNLTSAVKKVLQGHKRQLQGNFERFISYYSITARFCNPGKGHEKGGVEGIIGYVRRNYFVPAPVHETLESLNDALLQSCIEYGSHTIDGREETVSEAFLKEQEHLLLLPAHSYQLTESVQAKVNKYSTVLIDRNHYSVPTKYASYKVTVLMTIDTVSVYSANRLIARHSRVFGCNKWQLDPEHYLDLIATRPQAFESARPLRQWRSSWPASHEQLFTQFCHKNSYNRGVKEFIQVLQMYQEFAKDEVEAAIELAVHTNLSGASGVRHLLEHTFSISEDHESLPHYGHLSDPDPSVYALLEGVS